ncbi:MAG: pyridoxal phosphate-dependent aminotransferase [Cyanobacteriota bacterium]|nr:pyridoxal phosphate-dependent aminotransferase [Cyanobacteriota bacterium]
MMDPGLFSDGQVPLDLLRQRAFNLRWATLPSDVIPLTAADPDFAVAPAIREAIAAHAHEGVFSYGPAEGLPRFRQACARFSADRRDCGPADPERILAVDGAAAGLRHVCRLLLQPGDEAIIFDPVDYLLAEAVEAAGGRVRRLPVDPLGGPLELEPLEGLLTPRTRLLVVCNPLNPVGRVLRRQELDQLAGFALRHNLQILSDEVWSAIVYSPHRFGSMAALDGAVAARTWTVHGLSKSHGLAGLRVGFVLCPDREGCRRLLKASLAASTMSGVATLSQVAAVAALEEGQPWLEAWLEHLHQRRNQAVAALAPMPGVRINPPEGTFVLFPQVAHHGLKAEALATWLLERHRVAVVPGACRWFGPRAEGHLRLVFSTSEAILTEALQRLRRGLEELAAGEGPRSSPQGTDHQIP